MPNAEAAALDARFPDLPKTLAQCITCRGRKTFRWYAPLSERTTVAEYQCPCPEQRTLHRHLINCGLELAYQRKGWADFDYLPPAALAEAQKYLGNSGYVESGFGMIIFGDQGNGKTLLATLMLKHFISLGYDCYATRFTDLIDLYAGGWKDKDQRVWFDRRIRNAGILLVDDIGRERIKGSGSVGESVLEEVIRARVASDKPTFITTNFDPDKMEGGYGGHTMSLLSERAVLCEFVGQDRRVEMRHRFDAEVKAGLKRPVVLA